MNKTEVMKRIRALLKKIDSEAEVLNRKVSSKHRNDLEVLLDNLAVVMECMKLDAEASRRELFAARKALET